MLSKIFLMAAAGAGSVGVDLTNYIKFLTNASNVEIVRSTVRDKSGNVYIAAKEGGYLILVKLNINGAVVWCKQHWMTEIYNMAVDSSNNLYVLGKQGTGCYVHKYNTSGDFIAQYKTAVDFITLPTYIAIDNQDNIIITGYDGNHVAYVLKFSNNGTFIFGKQYFLNSSTSVKFQYVATDSSNNIIIAGVYNPIGGYEFCLIKLTPDGTLVFQKRFGTSVTNDYDTTTSLTLDNNDNIYLVGITTYLNRGVPCITKFDSSGNIVASRIFQSTESHYMATVAADNNNNIHLVSVKWNATTSISSCHYAKIDSNLNLLFQCSIGPAESGYAFYNYSVNCCVDSVNNLIYITGLLSSKDIELIRLTTNNTKPGTYGSYDISNASLIYATRAQTLNNITGFTFSIKFYTINYSTSNVPLSAYSVVESTVIIP